MPIYTKSLPNSPPAIILLIEKILLYPCEFLLSLTFVVALTIEMGTYFVFFQQAIKEMGYLLGCLFYA